jgi:hypothetical protein
MNGVAVFGLRPELERAVAAIGYGGDSPPPGAPAKPTTAAGPMADQTHSQAPAIFPRREPTQRPGSPCRRSSVRPAPKSPAPITG